MLSCHALDNTPVLPITDKYVSKPPTRDITSTQVKFIYGDDSIIEEELLDDVVAQKICMSLSDNVRVMIIIYKDIPGTALRQDTPPTGTAPSAPHGIIQYDPPQLSTRENNSTEITCVHSDDSINVPSTLLLDPGQNNTVTDSYIWGTWRNNYGECSIVTILSMTLMNYHLILSPIVTTLLMIIHMNYPSLMLWTINGEQLWRKLGNNYGEHYLSSSFITLGHQHVRSLGNVT